MIITSLAPSHKNKEAQLNAVESWKKTGHRIVSVNHASEIELLKEYDVEFIEPEKTGFELFDKHYIPISEILKIIIKEGSGIILNSDIILTGLPEFGTEALIFSRYDYETDISNAEIFRSGYDGFYLTKEHCLTLPESKLCLGQCHWDYWLPVMLISKRIKISRPTTPYLYHKKHHLQYDMISWTKTATIFQKETNIGGSNQKASNIAYNLIRTKIVNA